MKRLLAVVGMCLGIGSVHADNMPTGPVPFKASARVVIDTDGVPSRVEASGKLPEPIRQAVEQRAMQMRFAPLVIDGKPRVGTTHVFMDGCVVAREDGRLNLALEYSRNGPGYAGGDARLQPPAYPQQALIRGIEARFHAIVRVNTDGHVVLEELKRQKGDLKSFKAAVQEWVALLRYLPEEIDGMPISTRLSIPVEFRLEMRSPEQAAQEELAQTKGASACMAASKEDRDTAPVVLDSPFKPISAG